MIIATQDYTWTHPTSPNTCEQMTLCRVERDFTCSFDFFKAKRFNDLDCSFTYVISSGSPAYVAISIPTKKLRQKQIM